MDVPVVEVPPCPLRAPWCGRESAVPDQAQSVVARGAAGGAAGRAGAAGPPFGGGWCGPPGRGVVGGAWETRGGRRNRGAKE
ncbi:hypothetical protein GCM10018980_58080 [Streptomyces capoamus]|uniref:Uncharacterized protein n=1 Tax=Streptomyces capoamus TaxID=68183 RepID=A0A919F016_9ACTN|nr:hypothetical protein GCM10010501_47770 [Streptomyces libani subsp. rufus]GHG66067.1 hypothetical protein GCM10018980_58080 [Streptomyces capoamus]